MFFVFWIYFMFKSDKESLLLYLQRANEKNLIKTHPTGLLIHFPLTTQRINGIHPFFSFYFSNISFLIIIHCLPLVFIAVRETHFTQSEKLEEFLWHVGVKTETPCFVCVTCRHYIWSCQLHWRMMQPYPTHTPQTHVGVSDFRRWEYF